ncbi:anti-phage-associated DUF499 domain-containing protein [Pyxidicoccus sp. 3LFB2]
MLKTVKDACKPHEMAFNSAMGEQIEDLAQLIVDASDGSAFYAKNYVTRGMHQLFEQGLKRLAGKSEQAVFELTQAMGGGKTHTMVAFGLLAKHEPLRNKVVPELARAAPFKSARLAAVTGRKYPEHFLWGEIAAQLGKPDDFRKYWQHGADAPDEDAWIKLIGDEPTLILLDELPPYFEYALTRPVGGGTLANVTTAALSNLFSAALKLKKLCVVVSNLSSSYEKASTELHKTIRNVQQEAKRQARPITPVELGGDEVYQILKKRLFSELPTEKDIEDVVQAYAKAIGEAEKSKSIAKSTEQLADEIRGSYPFHPSIKNIVALFRNNESYRQTRGLMQFVSRMIQSVWNRKANDVHLIGLQHLDLNDPDVRDEIVRINDLRGAIATDIASGGAAHAETIDATSQNDGATQVATLLLAASLSSAVDAVKGLTLQRLLEYLIAPNRQVHEFSEAFDHLRREAWYLHRDASDAFYFSSNENLTKRLSTEAERAPQPKVDLEMRRRLEAIFAARNRLAYQEVKALPVIDEVKLNGPRVLLILSPDSRNPPEAAKNFFDGVVEKNNMCILTGDGSDITNLEEKTRSIYAIAKLQKELPQASPHHSDLEEKAIAAEKDFNSTVVALFNRIYYPTKNGLAHARLAMQFEANKFEGEEQIEKALSGTGVSKLVLSIEKDPQAHFQKAEDLLWPESQKRLPWNDVKKRALGNPRWTWLPGANGMDALRKLAEEQGRWRYTEDGYIERGPFEQPKTSVSIIERGYDEETGMAELEVTAIHAGKAPQIFYDTSPAVSPTSTRLTEPRLKSDATQLYFLAVDPTKEHETGSAEPWSNKLTITYQPREGAGSRVVELRVVPRGTIRYTLTGANPAEGTLYSKPIEVSAAETTIFCYAEDNGVSVKRNFTLPRAGNTGVVVVPNKPAKLKKKVASQDTSETFKTLKSVRDARSKVSEAMIEVGGGAQTATLRFGSEASLGADQIEALVKALRTALGSDTADVRLSFRGVAFEAGHDLDGFVKELGLQIGPNEVEQA